MLGMAILIVTIVTASSLLVTFQVLQNTNNIKKQISKININCKNYSPALQQIQNSIDNLPQADFGPRIR